MRGRRLPSPVKRWSGARRYRPLKPYDFPLGYPPWNMRHMSQSEEFTVLSRNPTLPPRIYYTCMNYWMQLGLLRDLLHLHELVIGNLAFISDRSVGSTEKRSCGLEMYIK